jgi:SAM-dependent methyltransferase
LRKFIGKDDKVLEIGCAFGKILPADFGSSVEYVELDNGDLDDTLNQYAPALFDKVVVSMGVEYISEPRETFQDVWRVLKPEGQCFVSFKSARVPSVLPPIKMWTEMNDEQKIWIAGSYMHYAGSQFGFKNIEGYDILGSTGQKAMEFTKGEPGETLFVVHGTRAGLPVLDPSNFTSVREYCVSTLRGVRNLKLDDQEFMGLRMAGEYMRAETDEDKNAVLSSAGRLSQIYSVLKDVKEVVIPAPVKAMLASWLLPKWKNTGVQLLALKRGLGLDTSDPDFWPVLGRITAPMEPKDKIALLADVIAAFGEQKNVEQIPQLLEQVTEAIQANMSAEVSIYLHIYLRGGFEFYA